MTGRFAPSPTGALHVGNLRTALFAWLMARSAGERFVLRIEDLDRVTSSLAHERSQLADLAALGIDWDNDAHGEVWRQSARFDVYDTAIDRLTSCGATYECYCSRREIRNAAAAPHAGERVYPGTCRNLTEAERVVRRRDRPPAIRLRSNGHLATIDDVVAGRFVGPSQDVVLRRNDGVPAYHLAVVVDDAAQAIDEVVRGDDLLASTPSQIALQRALGLPTPAYAHVPLVVGPSGGRLAKRDGAVTFDDLGRLDISNARVVRGLARSIGIDVSGQPVTAVDLIEPFAARLTPPRQPISLARLMSEICDRSGIVP